jgi:hypothetical protein
VDVSMGGGDSSMNDTSGCALVLIVAFALFVGIVILAAVAEVAAQLTGCNSNTVLGWEFGILGTVLFVWMLLRHPLLRFSVLVTVTATGMIVLLLALNGGHEQGLDSPWTKVFVAGTSVGVGAVYLFWDLKRHPLDGP